MILISSDIIEHNIFPFLYFRDILLLTSTCKDFYFLRKPEVFKDFSIYITSKNIKRWKNRKDNVFSNVVAYCDISDIPIHLFKNIIFLKCTSSNTLSANIINTMMIKKLEIKNININNMYNKSLETLKANIAPTPVNLSNVVSAFPSLHSLYVLSDKSVVADSYLKTLSIISPKPIILSSFNKLYLDYLGSSFNVQLNEVENLSIIGSTCKNIIIAPNTLKTLELFNNLFTFKINNNIEKIMTNTKLIVEDVLPKLKHLEIHYYADDILPYMPNIEHLEIHYKSNFNINYKKIHTLIYARNVSPKLSMFNNLNLRHLDVQIGSFQDGFLLDFPNLTDLILTCPPVYNVEIGRENIKCPKLKRFSITAYNARNLKKHLMDGYDTSTLITATETEALNEINTNHLILRYLGVNNLTVNCKYINTITCNSKNITIINYNKIC